MTAVNFVLGVLLLWVGGAGLFLSMHSGPQSLWDLYQGLFAHMKGTA
jgi:hypothetical protein